MNRTHLSCAAAVAVTALVVAGCGGGSSSSSGSGGSATSASTAAGGAAVGTAKTSLGTVVVDGSGRTLYRFAKDTGSKSTCSGSCAAAWPPFTAAAKPATSGGVPGSGLTLVKRSDGKRQVVMDGHPLYFFKGDTSAGQLNGQAVDAFGAKWYVVGPTGKTVTATSTGSSSGPGASTGSTGSSGRSGYGY
jgi:predicted lipoprotein with Yx(FWY)xxD motif